MRRSTYTALREVFIDYSLFLFGGLFSPVPRTTYVAGGASVISANPEEKKSVFVYGVC